MRGNVSTPVTIVDGNGNVITALPVTDNGGALTIDDGNGSLTVDDKTLDSYRATSSGITVAANKLMCDLFNASGSGKIVRIRRIRVVLANSAAVTGVYIEFIVTHTASVGTGGSIITIQKIDPADADLPSQITFRSGTTGGAGSAGTGVVAGGGMNTEEGVNYMPHSELYRHEGGPLEAITLNEGQGIRIDTGAVGAAGTVRFIIEFTTE